MDDGGFPKAAEEAAALPPLTGLQLVIAAMLTALANLFATLDLTIANVSIPDISSGLGVSPHEGTWVITSYAVAEAITVPLTGWFAQRFGPARVFIFALTGFGLASALCGLAPSFRVLLLFRVLQGLAGGPMIPLSQTLLLTMMPRQRSELAVGIWSMTAVIGPVVGPILGGQICDNLSWPWIFLINVPVTLLTAFLCAGLLLRRDPPPQRRRVDLIGLGLMIVWIGAIQIMLDRGQELDWFGSPLIVALMVIGVIGFIAFLIWELTDPNPIVNLRIFRSRSFVTATAVICTGFGVYFGSVVVTPLWLQTNMGYTPGWAGLVNAPPGAMVFCLSPLVAWLTSRVDSRYLIFTAMLVFAGAFFWRAHFASNVTVQMLLGTQAMFGMCIAFLFAPATSLALSAVKPSEIAAAAGLMSFCRTTALAFATSLSTTAWQNATARDRVALVDRFAGASALRDFTAAGSTPAQALWHIDGLVQSQAVMLATNDTYFVFAAVLAFASFCVWIAPSSRSRGPVAAH